MEAWGAWLPPPRATDMGDGRGMMVWERANMVFGNEARSRTVPQRSVSLPTISIVTPTRRMARYLETAIRSVAKQDYGRIEYIIVDGGDDLETPEVVRRYPEVVSRYVREADRGQAHAINKGFRQASGEILAWVNADDYYYPDAASRAAKAFERDTTLDVYYGDAAYVDHDGQFLRYFTEAEPPSVQQLCDYGNCICQPTVFMRRRALERVGLLDENLHYAMDWDLWCRMARAGCRFHYEQALIAVNREYPETKTLRGGADRLAEILTVSLRHRTGWFPRPFVSFTLGALPRIAPWAAPLVSAGLSPARLVKRAVWGRKEVRPIHGLYHHSADAARVARVVLPTPLVRPEQLGIRLGLPPGLEEQHLSIRVNDRSLGDLHLHSARCPEIFRFDLGEIPIDGCVSMELSATNVGYRGGREVCFRLEAVRLDREPLPAQALGYGNASLSPANPNHDENHQRMM